MLTAPGSIRVVMLDAVGTVIYPRPSAAEVYATHGRQFGSRLDTETIADRLQESLQQLATDCGNTTDEAREYARWKTIVTQVFDDVPNAGGTLFQNLWHHFAQAEHWCVYDDVPAAWADLEALGLPIGIASNFDARLPPICNQLAPLDRHQHLFYSSRVGVAKPHPNFFHTIQQTLDLPAHAILLVGDDVRNDFLGAAEAGWQSVLLDRTGTSELPAIRSLRQLCKLLA